MTKHIVATVLTFHRSRDWEKNTKELDIRSKTAQFPDTIRGIDAVRDPRPVSTLRNAQSGDAHANPDATHMAEGFFIHLC